jgi:phage shock protein E
MDWTTLAIAAVVVTAWLLLKRRSLANPDTVRRLHAGGAPLIDVRTASEFQSGSLPGALNIPLDRIRDELPRRVTDRSAPILLHCASGTRSGIARGRAVGLGYRDVHNVGSLSRTTSILGIS